MTMFEFSGSQPEKLVKERRSTSIPISSPSASIGTGIGANISPAKAVAYIKE